MDADVKFGLQQLRNITRTLESRLEMLREKLEELAEQLREFQADKEGSK